MANLITGAGLFLNQQAQQNQQELDIKQQALGLNMNKLTLDRRLQYSQAAEDVVKQLGPQIQAGAPKELILQAAQQLLGGLTQGMATDQDPQNAQFAQAVNQKTLQLLSAIPTPQETAAAKGQAAVSGAQATIDASQSLPPGAREALLQSQNAALPLSTDAARQQQDRQTLIGTFGEGSPQVRQFDRIENQKQALADASLKETQAKAQKSILELNNLISGKNVLDPKDKAQVEGKLRDDFTGATKNFATVRDSFQRIAGYRGTPPTAAGDLALIFNYMKILDPGSVVRESEFATAQNAAGVPDRIRALYNRTIDGQKLAEAQRADFIDQSQRLFDGQKQIYLNSAQQYADIAKRSGVDPQNVVTDLLAGVKQQTGASPAGPAAGQVDIGSATLDTLLTIDPTKLSDSDRTKYDRALKAHGY